MPRVKSVRSQIRAYRLSGRMFGQTFHTGAPAPSGLQLKLAQLRQSHFCNWRELKEFFQNRHQIDWSRYDRRHHVEFLVQQYRDSAKQVQDFLHSISENEKLKLLQ